MTEPMTLGTKMRVGMPEGVGLGKRPSGGDGLGRTPAERFWEQQLGVLEADTEAGFPLEGTAGLGFHGGSCRGNSGLGDG